jgi:hypothetical protein
MQNLLQLADLCDSDTVFERIGTRPAADGGDGQAVETKALVFSDSQAWSIHDIYKGQNNGRDDR